MTIFSVDVEKVSWFKYICVFKVISFFRQVFTTLYESLRLMTSVCRTVQFQFIWLYILFNDFFLLFCKIENPEIKSLFDKKKVSKVIITWRGIFFFLHAIMILHQCSFYIWISVYYYIFSWIFFSHLIFQETQFFFQFFNIAHNNDILM